MQHLIKLIHKFPEFKVDAQIENFLFIIFLLAKKRQRN